MNRTSDTYQTTNTTLGDLISTLYDEYMAVYKDADIASVAAAATINDLLADALDDAEEVEAAA